MTDQQNLKRRLGELGFTSEPSLLHKAALRAELVSRGRHRKRGRSLAMAMVVVVVFGVTIFDEQPLESFNFGLNYVGTIGHTAYFEGLSSSVGNYGHIEGYENNLTQVSEEKALLVKDDIELFNSLHLAGLTQLDQIFGYTVRGRTKLTAFYTSLADTLLNRGAIPIVSQFKPTDLDLMEILKFVTDRHGQLRRSTIYNKDVSALRDSLIEIQGVEYPISIYAAQDSILGEVLLYHYRRDSSHN